MGLLLTAQLSRGSNEYRKSRTTFKKGIVSGLEEEKSSSNSSSEIEDEIGEEEPEFEQKEEEEEK